MTIGGLNAATFYLTSYRRVFGPDAPFDAPRRAKVLAAISLCAWIGVITGGRLLTFYRPSAWPAADLAATHLRSMTERGRTKPGSCRIQLENDDRPLQIANSHAREAMRRCSRRVTLMLNIGTAEESITPVAIFPGHDSADEFARIR